MISISIVVPYKDLYRQVEHYLKQVDVRGFKIELTHYVGSQNQFITNCDADIVVARGITSKAFSNQNADVHSVEISITGRDLISALHKCRQAYGNMKVGIVVTDPSLCDPQQLQDLTGMSLLVRQAENQDQVFSEIEQLKAEGAQVFIGGLTLCHRCEQLGYPFVHIKNGTESITRAIHEAIATARSLERERARANLITAVLNNTEDAMFAVNQHGVVTAANTKAEILFAHNVRSEDDASGDASVKNSPTLHAARLTGLGIEEVYPDCRWVQVLENQEEAEELKTIKNQLVLIKKIPIMVHRTESVGVLFVCRSVEAIRKTEHKVRKVLSKKGLAARYSFADIISTNDHMKRIIATAYKYSLADSNILILGETGTGKELFAQSIHNASERSSHPFVAVNCAALPEQLLESELFGYTEGAFSGAIKGGKMGLFELAHTGTIFLDEIGEMPLSLQAKILRVLQEREIRRVGGDVVVPIDVRIISATNIDILDKIREGLFRQDLFYRINVLNLQIPALRERPDDIELLFSHFIEDYAKKEKRRIPAVRRPVYNILKQYKWLGNIRELRNLCERLVIINETGIIEQQDVESSCFLEERTRIEGVRSSAEADETMINRGGSLTEQLKQSGLSRNEFAKMLGLSRTTLWRRLREEALEDGKVLAY